jgi:hypothetical protein
MSCQWVPYSRFSIMWVVARFRSVFIDVSAQHIGPIFKGQDFFWDVLRVKLEMWAERLYIDLRLKCLYCSEIHIEFNEFLPNSASGKRDKMKFTQQPKCRPQYQTMSKFVEQFRKWSIKLYGWTQIYHRAYTLSTRGISTTNLTMQPWGKAWK